MEEIEEDVVEPELRIIDAHHHLWNIPGDCYTTQDLLKDVDGQKVVKTVCVEAWRHAQQTGWVKEPIEETAFAAADSTRYKSSTQVAAGIVGYVDLTEGDRAARLIEAHIAAGRGRFRGIRVPFESIFDDPKFIEGFRCVVYVR